MMKRSANNYSVQPYHLTSSKIRKRHINLLLVEEYYVEEDGDDAANDNDDALPPKIHYVWIENLSRLIRKQLTSSKNKCYVCDRCLHFFNTNDRLEEHELNCEQVNNCKIQRDFVILVRNSFLHLTGCYRGAAHKGCNINSKDARFIPIVFHNLTGYDSHLIVKELATAPNFKERVQLLAENKERYIAFTKFIKGSNINFRFIDLFRFMPSSLVKLAPYLEKYDITRSVFEKDDQYTHDQIKLLLGKGVFPHDHVSSFDKLKQETLPFKADFYSKLYESEINDVEYEHAKNVWSAMKIKTLGEYSDVYLKTDVLLLTDIFENFRTTCIDAYGLDPAHYYTTPGLRNNVRCYA